MVFAVDENVEKTIRLPVVELADREFTRIETGCATDSEVLRQALRNVEQLLNDIESGTKLSIHRLDGSVIEVIPSLFKDSPENMGAMIGEDLIVQTRSAERLDVLTRRLEVEDISATARIAYRFLHRVAKEVAERSKFIREDRDGNVQEVPFGPPKPDKQHASLLHRASSFLKQKL